MTGHIGVAHAPSPYRASNQRSDDGTAQGGAKCRMQMRKQLPLFYPAIFCHYSLSFIFDNLRKGYGTVELSSLRYSLV